MEIHPFRGWRYNCSDQADLSDRIAPPYDVLSAENKEQLLAQCESNIVAVDLPHVPPKDVGPEEAYVNAASLLERWKADGTLCQSDRPVVYLYEQTFQWSGKTYIRRALLCSIRITEFGKDVIPHEHTFAGPKADRLKLMQHTHMQLSPIFGFFNDPQSQVCNILELTADSPPTVEGVLRDVTERMWIIDAETTIEEITAVLRDVPVYIADGHHRYTTAMNYRDEMKATQNIDDNHEANFVMFALVPRNDPGLRALPTHRLVSGLDAGFTVESMIQKLGCFDWQRCSVDDFDVRDAGSFLRKYGPGSMAFLDADPAQIWIGKLSDPQAMVTAAPEELDQWRSLDVAVLHKLIIDRALSPWRTDDLCIDYTPDARGVLAACQSGRAQLGICLQGTPIDAVQAVADVGAAMPHKSTYFFPKVATGMVLKPLE